MGLGSGNAIKLVVIAITLVGAFAVIAFAVSLFTGWNDTETGSQWLQYGVWAAGLCAVLGVVVAVIAAAGERRR